MSEFEALNVCFQLGSKLQQSKLPSYRQVSTKLIYDAN